MNKRHLILPILLVFLFNAGLSFGQNVGNNQNNASSMTEKITTPEKINMPENASASKNITAPHLASNATAINATTTIPKLQYIWSLTGIEKDRITMVLNQEGADIYGAAKYEPEGGETWNANVVGSVLGEHINMAITALKGKDIVSTWLDGTFANEAINGMFFQVTNGKISVRGDFSAMWINPNISEYVPAKIAEAKKETLAPTTNLTAPAAATNKTGLQPVQLGKSKYHDVRQDADRIMTGVGDLSNIPIGMGGSGLP